MSRDTDGKSGAGGAIDGILGARSARSLCDSHAIDGPACADPSDILRRYADATGLADSLMPFPHGENLTSRLAANPLLMAPMAGVSDAAYRMMMRAGGASLAYSEMVSVAGLHYASQKTWELVLPQSPEPDIAVQLFGSDPTQFGEAVCAVQERLGNSLVLIDINMACPVPKVTKGGAGSALLDNPDLAKDIVRTCVREATVPVTVKIRRGRRMGDEVAPQFAQAMQEAGASAVAIHGRYAKQLYHGDADWGVVGRVAEAVDIPVIGSGDVCSYAEAMRMLASTGCQAVMIARGTYGNPWVFCGKEPTTAQRLAAYACHVRLLDATHAHMARARSLAGWYLRGMPHAAYWRNRSMSCVATDDYLAMVEELIAAGDGS